MALEEDLALNIGPAESAVDRLGKLLDQQAKLFSSALGQAVQVLNGIPVSVTTSDVTSSIDAAVDAADTTTEVEAEAGDVTASIDGAVDAADTSVDVEGEAGSVTAEIDAAVDAADTTVELDIDADESERAVSGLNVSMGTLLKTAAAVAAIDFFKTGVESLARIEQISLQTDARIKSTGAAANVTTQEIEALADELERTTAAEAETTQEGANLLLTFTGIVDRVGEGNDIFSQAVVTMNDLSVVMGTDAKSSALQLGKALENPTKGVSALARSGVSFSEDQKAMIESLQESGDLLGAQKVVLEQVQVQVEGAAEAYGGSLAGRVALAGHAFGTFQEEASAALLPILEMGLDALPELLAALQPLLNSLAELGGAALPGVIQSLHTLLPIIQLVGDIVALIPPDAVALGTALFVVSRATIPLAAGLKKVGVAASVANPLLAALTIAAAVAVTVMGDNAAAERERKAAIDATADALRDAENAQEAYSDGIGELLAGTDGLSEALREAGVTQSELTQATLNDTNQQRFWNDIKARGIDLSFDEAVQLDRLIATQREGARVAFDGALATEEFSKAQADAAIEANTAEDDIIDYAAALDDARDAALGTTKAQGTFAKATKEVGVIVQATEEQMEAQAEGVKAALESIDNYVLNVQNSLPKVADAWQDLNDDGTVSLKEFTKTLEEQTLEIAAFPETIKTLMDQGFDDLANFLRGQGAEFTADFMKQIEAGEPGVAAALDKTIGDNVQAEIDATDAFLRGPGAEKLRSSAGAAGVLVGATFGIGASTMSDETESAIVGALREFEDSQDDIDRTGQRSGAGLGEAFGVGAKERALRRIQEMLAEAGAALATFGFTGVNSLSAQGQAALADAFAEFEAGNAGLVPYSDRSAAVALPGAAAPAAKSTTVGAINLAVNVSGTVSAGEAQQIGEAVAVAAGTKLASVALLDVDFDSRIA